MKKEYALPSARTPKTAKAAPAADPAVSSQPGSSQGKGPEPLVLASRLAKKLDDDKAENILEIDLAGKSSIADAMVVASGRSQRHVAALADHVVREIKEAGLGKPHVEGLPNADWVLIDAGYVIVHIFRPEVREFYNIERLWAPDTGPAKRPRAGADA